MSGSISCSDSFSLNIDVDMTNEQIIQLICEGGESNHSKAIQAFYKRWASEMKGFFVSRGVSPDQAEDVFQECVVNVWTKAYQYKGEGTAQAWMWMIARNVLCDQLRKKKSGREFIELDEVTEATIPAPVAEEDTVSDCIDEGLKKLEADDSERAYVLQLLVAEVALQDIADRIGRSYGATRTYLTECRKKLRPYVEPCLELLTA